MNDQPYRTGGDGLLPTLRRLRDVACGGKAWDIIVAIDVEIGRATRDAAEGAKLVLPVCCYCDADLSCAKCGMEQPPDYPALPKPAPDAMRDDDGTYDEGITYAIAQLASLTGATDWQIRDGSESVEGDVRATILDVLKNANLYDEEDGRFATFAAPEPSSDEETKP